MKIALKAALALSLVLSQAFCLTGCSETNKAEKSVRVFFAELKDNGLEDAEKYVIIDDEDENADAVSKSDESDSEPYAITERLFDSIEYKIVSSEKVSNNEVTVTVEIEVNDMKDFFGKYVQEAYAYAFSGLREGELDAKMAEFADDYEFDTISYEHDITVEKDDETWKVVLDEELQDAVTGGLKSATAEFGESMS